MQKQGTEPAESHADVECAKLRGEMDALKEQLLVPQLYRPCLYVPQLHRL